MTSGSLGAASDEGVVPGSAITAQLPGCEPALAARLAIALNRVEAFLRERVDHNDPFIAEAGGHLLNAGGKRFRPLLCVLAAEVGSGAGDEVIAAAAAVMTPAATASS